MNTVIDLPAWFVPAFDLGYTAIMVISFGFSISNLFVWLWDLRALRTVVPVSEHQANADRLAPGEVGLTERSIRAIRQQRHGDVAMECMTLLGLLALILVGVAGAAGRSAHDQKVTALALAANLVIVLLIGLFGAKAILRRIVRRRVETTLRVDTSIR